MTFGSPIELLTRRMFTRIIAAVARSMQEHDLSVTQLVVLYALDEREALRVSDIAKELDLGLPTVSRLVDDLVRQKLVDRREDPNDRRARVVTLATKGRAFIAKSSEARMATMASVLVDAPKSSIEAFLSFAKRSR